ncbi:protein kinase domain-containing protein [Microlunatus sp. Y2014]|uniref:protein kinase domain-containing protein n=1 Tax=Microlunatus sp. Y2014 TaxID=3418488 RepID=UPI003DA71F42
MYFGNLLRNDGHVVQLKSAFPTTITYRGKKRTIFAINMELVSEGTVRDHLQKGGDPWSEAQILKRVRLLLKPLALLHEMGVSHRDITPPNVFIGNRKVLKLGDFGITKAQLKPSGVDADAMNPDFAPTDMGRWWRPADDVYQVGLLMASLAAGHEVTKGVRKPTINRYTVGAPKLRAAIKAAISVKSQRPQNAAELATLLK